MALQVREAVQVIVVHVAGHRDIDRLHAEIAAQVVDRVLHEADAIVDARSSRNVEKCRFEAEP